MGVLKIHHVKKARTTHVGLQVGEIIEIGEEYFWTKVNFTKKKVCSKDRKEVEKWIKNYLDNKRGEHSTNLDDWNTRMGELETEEEKEELLQEINDFLDQKNENLNNIPEQLQQNHIINEQIEELEQLIDEVESIEF